MLTVVDLFAGVGGFSLGFLKGCDATEKLGFDLRLLVDSDPSAVFTFKKNFPKIPYWLKDLSQVDGAEILRLTKLTSGDLDFLIGGPPCQGFSPNGKRWLEDNRNKLIARFIEISRKMRPKCAIIENVPTALSAYERLFNKEIHDAFKGYVAKTAVLNASAFGVPQIRKRAFIVALRNDLGISEFDFPKGRYRKRFPYAGESGAPLYFCERSYRRSPTAQSRPGDGRRAIPDSARNRIPRRTPQRFTRYFQSHSAVSFEGILKEDRTNPTWQGQL
jgi:DNA-cytosine methyltransferase